MKDDEDAQGQQLLASLRRELRLSNEQVKVLLLKLIGWRNKGVGEQVQVDEKTVSDWLNKYLYRQLIEGGRGAAAEQFDWEELSDRLNLEALFCAAGLEQLLPIRRAAEGGEATFKVLVAFLFKLLDLAARRRTFNVPVKELLEIIGWKGILLEGGGQHHYDYAPPHRVDIVCRWADEEGYSGPADMRQQLSRLCDELWNETAAHSTVYGRPPIDPPRRVRLYEWLPQRTDSPGRPEDLEAPQIELLVQRTWYWYFLGTNFGMERAKLAGEDIALVDKRDPRNLRESILANCLSVSVCLITNAKVERDRVPRVLVQRRGRKVGHAHYRFQISGAGFMDVEDTLQKGYAPSPWIAAAREIFEETSIEVSPADIHFLCLGRETTNFEVGLCGFVQLPGGFDDYIGKPRKDSFEAEQLEWWPFEPEAVAKYLIPNGGWKTFVPLGALAFIMALVNFYGADNLYQAWLGSSEPKKLW